jgi:hypothetical protein
LTLRASDSAPTAEFTVDNKILTASFHILTSLPGTRAFTRFEAEGRILYRDWTRYDPYHAVFQPRRMTPEQLEAGYMRGKRQFAGCGSLAFEWRLHVARLGQLDVGGRDDFGRGLRAGPGG